MSELYDVDVYEWSQQQAALLRRRAAGKLGNEAELDWPNIAEEIESVGSEQLHSVEGLLVQALAHMLKAEAWPLSREVPGWQAEARGFRDDAIARLTPAIRGKLDLAKLYRRARRRVPDSIDGLPPLPLPPTCPVTLDALLSPDVDEEADALE